MTAVILSALWTLAKILAIVIPLMIMVAYLTLAERKIIGFMQMRIGPNRIGPFGLLQPLADGLKLFFKESMVPKASNPYLFVCAPILAIAPSLAAWAVIPFNDTWVLADIHVGLLYLMAMSSLVVYGIVIAGWASNSKYAFFGALRSSAQMVAYEISMGFALVGVVLASGSTNLREIVLAQQGSCLHWFWLPLLPLAVVYGISALAETNRAPFDVAEGESEIVAGFHVEYGGMSFALFFLAEYANMILVSCLMALMFLGGWLSPFEGVGILEPYLKQVPGILWLFLKISALLFVFLWCRATFPRYRYDQIMRLGWKILIPVTLFWLVVESFMVYFHVSPWFS